MPDVLITNCSVHHHQPSEKSEIFRICGVLSSSRGLRCHAINKSNAPQSGPDPTAMDDHMARDTSRVTTGRAVMMFANPLAMGLDRPRPSRPGLVDFGPRFIRSVR